MRSNSLINREINLNKLLRVYGTLLFLVISSLIISITYGIDELVATAVALGLIFPLLFLFEWPKYTGLIYTSFFIVIIVKIYYLMTLNPLAGPDEVNYYNQLIQYDGNLWGFVNYFIEELKTNHILMSAYPAFGIAYIPIYALLNTDSVYLIVIINLFSLVLLSFLIYKINVKHFDFDVANRDLFLSIAAAGIIISPSMMFWTSTFSKDVFGILVAIASLYFFLQKRKFISILLLAYATMIRPYSIVFVFIYYCIYKKKYKLLSFGALASIAIVFYFVGFEGVINSILSIAYLIASPNPLSVENWINYPIPAIESILIAGAVLLSAYLFMKDKKSRGFFYLCFTSILIYALTMTLVGHEFVTGRGGDYGVGVIGDNIMRKKLPVIMIFYTMLAYTFCNLTKRVRIK